jgi:hypothetical protein
MRSMAAASLSRGAISPGAARALGEAKRTFSAAAVFLSGTATRRRTTDPEATISLVRAAALLALIGVGITSLGGCVVQERRDGGVTVRPVHVE